MKFLLLTWLLLTKLRAGTKETAVYSTKVEDEVLYWTKVEDMDDVWEQQKRCSVFPDRNTALTDSILVQGLIATGEGIIFYRKKGSFKDHYESKDGKHTLTLGQMPGQLSKDGQTGFEKNIFVITEDYMEWSESPSYAVEDVVRKHGIMIYTNQRGESVKLVLDYVTDQEIAEYEADTRDNISKRVEATKEFKDHYIFGDIYGRSTGRHSNADMSSLGVRQWANELSVDDVNHPGQLMRARFYIPYPRRC